MDIIILGSGALAALIIGQFTAVIVVHCERKSRKPTIAPPLTDYRARMIWEGGS
jgi:hypothetical protein